MPHVYIIIRLIRPAHILELCSSPITKRLSFISVVRYGCTASNSANFNRVQKLLNGQVYFVSLLCDTLMPSITWCACWAGMWRNDNASEFSAGGTWFEYWMCMTCIYVARSVAFVMQQFNPNLAQFHHAVLRPRQPISVHCLELAALHQSTKTWDLSAQHQPRHGSSLAPPRAIPASTGLVGVVLWRRGMSPADPESHLLAAAGSTPAKLAWRHFKLPAHVCWDTRGIGEGREVRRYCRGRDGYK